MLTREEGLVEYDYASGIPRPDRLTRKSHGHYLELAERLLEFYRLGIGKTRRELHRGVEITMAAVDDCPIRRIRALRKLLDDVSEFQADRQGQAAKLRKRVFSRAAALHPLVSSAEGIFTHCEQAAKRVIASELGKTWDDIDAALFADVIEFQRLLSFTSYPDASAFLARYNIAQTQAALYNAEHLTVWATTDFKMILRYAKLARLMHSIGRQPDGSYCFRFDGPASSLRTSTRYGVTLARFIPGLLACRGWRGLAKLKPMFGRQFRLELSDADGLKSTVAEVEAFDSSLEADFQVAWGPDAREGWRLEHETEILHLGQTVFTPDFVFVHSSGLRVFLEIIGFWTPEYLAAKAKTVRTFAAEPLLLAVAEQLSAKLPADLPSPILFKSRLKPKQVLDRLQALLDS